MGDLVELLQCQRRRLGRERQWRVEDAREHERVGDKIRWQPGVLRHNARGVDAWHGAALRRPCEAGLGLGLFAAHRRIEGKIRSRGRSHAEGRERRPDIALQGRGHRRQERLLRLAGDVVHLEGPQRPRHADGADLVVHHLRKEVLLLRPARVLRVGRLLLHHGTGDRRGHAGRLAVHVPPLVAAPRHQLPILQRDREVLRRLEEQTLAVQKPTLGVHRNGAGPRLLYLGVQVRQLPEQGHRPGVYQEEADVHLTWRPEQR
mmetsp:Transcript_103888/g.300476  ORF Transcript_103888/g.300476 Transcript_103888/m.300476 type:complete len:261 (+) Transcript_103888:1254-2036(+)